MSRKRRRRYEELRQIVEQRKGSMEYQRAGYRHGAWIVTFGERTKIFQAQGNRRLPELDRLYLPKVPSSKTWDDYSNELIPYAEEKFLQLLEDAS